MVQTWQWYSDAALTVTEGTGNSIVVNPATSTTYYVRAEGACNITVDIGQLVTVKTQSVMPDTAFVDMAEFCFGAVDSIILSYSGGMLGSGSDAFWYEDSLFADIAFATGNDVTIAAPVDTSAYFVRFEGDCDTTSALKVIVIVNPQPAPSISGDTIYMYTYSSRIFCIRLSGVQHTVGL